MKLSKLKQAQNREYAKRRPVFIYSKRDKYNNIYCIFCGLLIRLDPDIHHGLGRDGDLLLNERYWFLSHNECHVHQYHSMSCKDIPWWRDYIERIKHIPEILCKEELRMDKAGMDK